MRSSEIKKEITKYLGDIEDEQFLDAIKTLLASKVGSVPYVLSEEQLKRVEETKEELKSGKTIPNSKVQEDIDRWLSE